MPKNTEGRGEAKEFTLNILPLPLGEGRGEGWQNNSTLTTKTEGWGEATEFTLDSLPLPLGEGRGEGKHWQKALQTATLSLALSFFIAAPVMAADTPPVPTLDRVKAENKTFINSAHSTYTLTELTADETAPEGSITINIADKTYYYTPNAGDNTNTLQLISATGSTALIETTSDKALYTVGDKYYTYTPDKLKDSAYTLTETTVSDPENLPDNVITLYDKTEVTKYYDPTTGLEVAESDRQEGVEYKEVTTIETTPKYYTVSLKQTEYGDKTADSAKPVYFKWTTDADGNKQLTQDGASADDYNIVYYMQTEYGDSNGTTTLTYGWEKNADTGNVEFKQDPQTPVGQTITYKYNPDSFTQKVEGQTSNPTVTNPSSNSSSNSYIIEGGVGLNNSEGSTQSIDNVLYKDNKVTGTLESTTSGSKYGQVSGGAVYNAGELTSISGAFINNGVEAQEIETKGYVFNDAQGGALYNSGTVGNIAADFIGNYASGRKANGGAIFNDGTIGNITGDFIGNYALCEGGAIFNDGTIGNITGDFIGNYVSDSGLGATTYGGAIYNDYGTIGDITGDFIGNYVSGYLWVYGGAIYNSGTIGDITGDFIGNYVSNDDQDYGGGAIYNDDEGTIEDITGDFIGNYASGNTGCSGGAIYNRGTIGNITGDFIGNYASASSTRFSGYGGAIYNRGTIGDITGDFIGNYGEAIYNSGTIGNITGDFIGNYGAKSETNYTSGGAIYNGGGGTIGNITGDFIGNYASSTRYSGYGGAIYNGGGGTIGNITGDFIGNYVSGSGSGATTYGGAIYNYYGTIGDITGDFIGNYAYSNALDAGFPDYPYVYGGAICNYNGEIDNITGDFIGNYTYSYAKRSIDDNLYAQGGAISNVGRDGRYSIIRNITGDFIGNYAYSDRYAKGGAISNGNNATIENITGDFIGNYVSGGYEAQGGAIYNYAHELIGDITGDFIGNYATGDSSAYGGAICNDIGTIGDITGDFIGNYVSSTGYDAYGGAIYNYRTIYNDRGTIVDISGNFIGNYATGDSSAYGGAIYNIGTIGNITGDFIGNYVSSGSSDIYTYAKGGAIYNTGTIGTSDGGIINSSFINNYAKSETGTAQGGAIWTNNDLNIIAKDGGKSVFSGNYIESNGIKTPNAIFVGNPNDTNTTINNITKDTVEYTVETNADYNLPTLTLNASTNGVIIFNDTIEGDGNGTKVIRGDLVVSKWGKEYYGVSTVDEYVNYLKDQDWYDDYTDEEILQEGVEYEELVSINEQTVSETITDGYDLHLTGDSTGAIYLNNEIKNADISIDTTNVYVNEGTNLAPSRSLAVNSGVLNINHLANQTVNFNKFSNSSQINIGSVDVDLANESMGRITADEYGDVSGSVNVQGVKLLSDAKEQNRYLICR